MKAIENLNEWNLIKKLASETTQPSKEEAAIIMQLPLNALKIYPSVFQPRLPLRADNATERENHVEVLCNALKNEGQLTPLYVWKLKDEWVVLDGHHRLQAYQQCQVNPVPVKVFVGSFNGAIMTASAMNRMDRLRLTVNEKENAAWRIVTEEMPYSLNTVASVTGISRSSVHRMRQLWKQLGKEHEDMSLQVLRTFTYCEVRKRFSNQPTHIHWKQRHFEGIKQTISQSIGKHIRRNPDLIARAIVELYPERAKVIANMLLAKPKLVSLGVESDS